MDCEASFPRLIAIKMPELLAVMYTVRVSGLVVLLSQESNEKAARRLNECNRDLT
jgi:hypothetical protein